MCGTEAFGSPRTLQGPQVVIARCLIFILRAQDGQ